MSIVELARPEIRRLRPYASARAIAGLAPVTLNANESPWPGVRDGDLALNRYPEPQPRALVAAYAAALGVEPAQMLVTRGSDEAIDLLVRAFCQAGQHAIVQCPPTFGMYGISAQIQGAGIVNVPLLAGQGFALDGAGVCEQALAQRAPLVFLCRPNNPTGQLFETQQLIDICQALAGRALVVVDEAYIDFCASHSVLALLQRFDNLAVLRTLSKAHALAGARCGALIAAAEVVELLKAILAPYPLPSPTIAVALRALQPDELEQSASQARRLVRARENLVQFLASLDAVVEQWPSVANFVLARFKDGPGLCRYLADHGVLVRNFHATPGLENCIRITAGSAHENARLMQLMEQWRP